MDPEVEAHCSSAEMARSSLVKIRILVVDDDSTALLVVTEVLRKWNYEVTGVMHPMEAISTLRMSRGLFDLIVTDYHMPIMNGIELQQRVQEEFDLPVIMMSGDNNEYVMLKSLECGAAFFILKPVKPVDCKNIWQYAVARSNKGKSIMVPKSISSPATAVLDEEDPSRVQALVNVSCRENGLKTKAQSKTKAKGQVSMKKPKVAWTNFLHNRFLQAVNFIGIEKAVPKKILELMNIPGLTRQNVASHLQKYRIFLRRVTEKGREHLMSSSNVLNSNPGLFFTAPQPPSMISSATRGGYPLLPMSQLRSPSLQYGLHRMSSPAVFNSCSTLDANRFPSEEAASGSRAGLSQQFFGTTKDARAILRSSISSFRLDLLNNTRDLSQHSAASDISTVLVSKQVFQNQLIQASQGPIITPNPSLLDCSSWNHELGLGNCSSSHGSTAFPRIAYPSGMNSGNTCISKGFGVNTSEEQLIATNQQLNNGITDRGLMGPACEDQKEQGENAVVSPTIIPSNPSNNCYTPQLSDGDLFDILSDQWLNLPTLGTQDNEEMLQASAFINDSIEDHRVAEENAPWDYEELLGPEMSTNQPAAAEPGNTNEVEQTISGNDTSEDFDFDYDFIKCLLASPTMD